MMCLFKVYALSHNSDKQEKNMVRFIVRYTVHSDVCMIKLAASLTTEFTHSSQFPTYIEMMANGGQVKSSFTPPSEAAAFSWVKVTFWVSFAHWAKCAMTSSLNEKQLLHSWQQ